METKAPLSTHVTTLSSPLSSLPVPTNESILDDLDTFDDPGPPIGDEPTHTSIIAVLAPRPLPTGNTDGGQTVRRVMEICDLRESFLRNDRLLFDAIEATSH
jgi:hypothetical protein